MGRWQPQPDGSVVGYFQSGLEFDFVGTSVSVTLGNTCRLLYRVDGGPVQRNITASGTVVLASGLENRRHSVQFYSEYQQSFPRVKYFEVGQVVPAAKRPAMEFVGDSISVGYIGPGLVNSLGSSFSYKTPELLGLSHNTVAFGGIAMTPGFGSPDKSGMLNRYTKLSEYVPGEVNVPEWDTSRYVPDYVVINLGTNDSTSPDFKPAYLAFLRNVRGYYPDVTIIAMSPFNTNHRDEIAEVVGTTGDLFVDTTGWIDRATETTDGTHPTIAAHNKIAGKLAAAIQQLTPLP
ncbi:GDSL-type esterase/lipase family protein [Kribbella sp. GL6]|uniref:GDSL-type esterase/lipase family protein n=1 Tax=Kribbella sp. GL6 TaxID=3419765 RepID=UPI003D040362